MYWILQILVTAGVLLAASRFMSSVQVRNFKTALLVAFFIGILSFLVGWLFTFILNVATLGIFYFLGLGFITRIVSFAIVIEIVDQFSKGFNTRGFLPSLWLAILLAIVGAILDGLFF